MSQSSSDAHTVPAVCVRGRTGTHTHPDMLRGRRRTSPFTSRRDVLCDAPQEQEAVKFNVTPGGSAATPFYVGVSL